MSPTLSSSGDRPTLRACCPCAPLSGDLPEATTSHPTSEPQVAPPAPPSGRVDNFFKHLGQAVSFILGAAVFVVANVVLVMMANPSWPNPAPQPDLRLPVAVVLGVVFVIVLLLGRTGRTFGLGFGAGLLLETLFMGPCTAHWYDPGGAPAREAEYARRRPMQEAAALQRAKAKWIREVREHGLDLAVGVHRLRLAAGCVLQHRQKEGEYPPVKDSLPESDICYEVHRIKDDETGWRVRYSRIPGKPGDPSDEFRVRAVPDAALKMLGPLVETDYRGLIFRRDSSNAPAFAVGSPLQVITGVLMDCIRKNANIKAESRKGVLTLRELVFYPGHCGRIQLEQVKTDGGYVLPDSNIARLYLPTTRAYVGFPLEDLSTSWNITYVPHGKTPADGYDLHVRPLTYGFSGIRSYLLTGDAIHVTWEDRPATPSDPPPLACESDINSACL
jgi:hypothetical protein